MPAVYYVVSVVDVLQNNIKYQFWYICIIHFKKYGVMLWETYQNDVAMPFLQLCVIMLHGSWAFDVIVIEVDAI